MSPTYDGGPAFPQNYNYLQSGMTLRDWFAGQIITGMMADRTRAGTYGEIAAEAYLQADAMLAARSKEETK